MKKISIIFLILSLILFTAIVKNSTKRIDDEIFAIKENLRILKKDFENSKLENNYLSSSEKLLKYQSLYFNDELVKRNITDINIIDIGSDELEIKKLKFAND
tara:strand:- start:979 stop:1284 length:306 start_codon:yes stop_codon:yes gene_type:complete